MTIEGQVLPFLTVGNIIIEPISTLTVMFFIYGIYVVLFGICMHILRQRKGQKLYLIWTVALFVLTTVANALETLDYVQEASREFEGARTRDYYPVWVYLHHDTLKTTLFSTLNALWIMTNITTDSMLIHRCYLIWNSRRLIAFSLGFLSVAINIFGIVTIVQSGIGISDTNNASKYRLFLKSSTLNAGYNIANAIVNIIITSMTAGRIWWITRQARALMGPAISQKYRTIVAIILESGILYPLFMVPYLVTSIGYEFGDNNFGLLPINFTPVIWQIAGIAPTLIIVRARLGRTVDSVEQMTTIHFAHGTGTTNQATSRLESLDILHLGEAEKQDCNRKEGSDITITSEFV